MFDLNKAPDTISAFIIIIFSTRYQSTTIIKSSFSAEKYADDTHALLRVTKLLSFVDIFGIVNRGHHLRLYRLYWNGFGLWNFLPRARISVDVIYGGESVFHLHAWPLCDFTDLCT